MTFYHGTSTKAGITDKILPPDNHEFGINEQGRTKHAQKVFFTTIKGYAEKYARNACHRAGGEPVVYEVFATNPKLMVESNGCDIYFDSEAIVGDGYPVKWKVRERRIRNKKIRKSLR